mmetsp:Transcript_44975/g.137368  ORF Transcript_44975/g.137368 Transcript_44975/m.137368 type:complete len:132 (+) Transcript_44975:43-438(+)
MSGEELRSKGQGLSGADRFDQMDSPESPNKSLKLDHSSDITARSNTAASNLSPATASLSEKRNDVIDLEATQRVGRSRKRYRRDLIIRIVSATYGPSYGRRLLNGRFVHAEADRVPYTRDILPILRQLFQR